MQRIGILAGMALACGCAEPFEAPSEYESQPYLCGDPAAFAAALDSCRERQADGSCSGVASMQGVLQSLPVTITSDIYVTEFFDEDVEGDAIRDRIDGIGRSPYFQFTLRVESIGGAISESEDPRELEFANNATAQENEFDDNLVTAALRMSNGADSTNPSFASGTMTITLQSETEQAGSFSAEVDEDDGDHLDGCFHYLAPEEE